MRQASAFAIRRLDAEVIPFVCCKLTDALRVPQSSLLFVTEIPDDRIWVKADLFGSFLDLAQADRSTLDALK